MSAGDDEPGTLMRHLPAIYRDSPALPALLAAFESVLLHQPDVEGPPGLGDTIARIPSLLRPLQTDAAGLDRTTPDDFLPWLAGWVGLSRTLVAILHDDRPHGDAASAGRRNEDAPLRRLIAGIVPLYASRGTRSHLERVLALCLPDIEEVRIDDSELPGFKVAGSRLGIDSWLVAYRPFHFRIAVRFAPLRGIEAHRKTRERALRIGAEAIIELSKPAHTSYTATWQYTQHDGEPGR